MDMKVMAEELPKKYANHDDYLNRACINDAGNGGIDGI